MVIFGVMITNQRVKKELEDGIKQDVKVQVSSPDKEQKVKRQGPVLCQVMLDPNRQYSESVFFIKGVEIARYKTAKEKIYDLSGTIPDGEVRFVNFTTNTRGTEHYRDNQRHGDYEEYYAEGPLKRIATYSKGKLKTVKDYFIDGKVRMEQDLQDAMYITDNDEVGIGKIYYRNGNLMYEWSLTNAGQGGFNKSYDRDGGLVEANYFDSNGIKTETKKYKENPPLDLAL